MKHRARNSNLAPVAVVSDMNTSAGCEDCEEMFQLVGSPSRPHIILVGYFSSQTPIELPCMINYPENSDLQKIALYSLPQNRL